MDWNENYQQILAEIRERGEEKYRLFNESLIPEVGKTYGVRIPQLRKMAKDIAAQDAAGFLSVARDDSQEERLLQGMVIGYAKATPDELERRIRHFVPKITNWAVCDTFCSCLKSVKRDPERYFPLIEQFFRSDGEYGRRFAVVMMMDYYLTDDAIEKVLLMIAALRDTRYYVQMAAAWALSVCLVKYRDKTLEVLESGVVQDEIFSMTVRKACDSFRVSQEDKLRLKQWAADKGR